MRTKHGNDGALLARHRVRVPEFSTRVYTGHCAAISTQQSLSKRLYPCIG
jgi:hypothetical protein